MVTKEERMQMAADSFIDAAVEQVLRPILLAALGIISGAILNLFLGSQMTDALNAVGLGEIKIWQLGCLLGFVTGFLKR